MKIFNKLIAVLATALLLSALLSIAVFANSYPTTISVSANSQLTSSLRYMDSTYHYMSIKITDKGSGKNKVQLREYYRGIMGDDIKYKDLKSMNKKKQYYYNLSNAGKGNFYIVFDGRVAVTGGPSTRYTGNPVKIASASGDWPYSTSLPDEPMVDVSDIK